MAEYPYDYDTLINSVGVGCESPVQSEQSYKDSLAAKNDTAREEIDADFAQRNADLKDYVQPDATKPPFAIDPAKLEKYRKEFLRIRAGHDSDGFYGVVPAPAPWPTAEAYRRLMKLVEAQQSVITSLENQLTKYRSV